MDNSYQKEKYSFDQLVIFNNNLKKPNINIIEYCIENTHFLQQHLIYITKYFKRFDFQTNDVSKMCELFTKLSSIVVFFENLSSKFEVDKAKNDFINIATFVDRFVVENTSDFLTDFTFQLSELAENIQKKAVSSLNQIHHTSNTNT